MTLSQILWFLVQCLAQTSRSRLSIEVSTLAYIPCATLMYYMWWDKPYEINVPTYIPVSPESIGTFSREKHVVPSEQEHRNSSYVFQIYQTYDILRRCLQKFAESYDSVRRGFTVATAYLVVGAVHSATWNFRWARGLESHLVKSACQYLEKNVLVGAQRCDKQGSREVD